MQTVHILLVFCCGVNAYKMHVCGEHGGKAYLFVCIIFLLFDLAVESAVVESHVTGWAITGAKVNLLLAGL